MVDSVARRRAALLVRRFQAQELTNDQLEDAWPRGSGDPALGQSLDAVWGLYSDLEEHTLEPSPATNELLETYADYLESDAEYRWPVPNPLLQLLWIPFAFVMLGLANRLVWRKYSFPPHWPFADAATREEARGRGARTEPGPTS